MAQLHPVVVVQGGQWGSEAKGAIAAKLCVDRCIAVAVRTGAINAGHTVVYNGKAYAMQQLPTGWVNPRTKLVIGPGAYIHPPTLYREIGMINEAMPGRDVRDRLFIDHRCGTHTADAEAASALANRHHSIGATGKGCSEAIVAKIRNRNNGYKLFIDTPPPLKLSPCFTDTAMMVNRYIEMGERVLIEGTQGTHLDLHLGPYPFTTSRMTSAANWVAEAGLSPALAYEVILVVRTFPIRVAGNSGPMPNEIEWVDLAREINARLEHGGRPPLVHPDALTEFEAVLERVAGSINNYAVPLNADNSTHHVRMSEWTYDKREKYRVAASELNRDALSACSPETVAELCKLFEMTTVTRKLRRLARLNIDDLRMAVMLNRPSSIALTFLDYVEPMLADATIETLSRNYDGLVTSACTRAARYISNLEMALGVKVSTVSTGPNPENTFEAIRLEYRSDGVYDTV